MTDRPDDQGQPAPAAQQGEPGQQARETLVDLPDPEPDRIGELEALVNERTEDLQRLQAEYMNYKRRVDRDRSLAREQGAESVVRELVPVFDAIGQAEASEQLSDGVRLVVNEFTRLANRLGLVTFGTAGEDFDPQLHEALMQIPTTEQPPMSVAQVIQPGYRLKDAVIRPARVGVACVPEQTTQDTTGPTSQQ